jgi:uncharacterized protein YdiU (UPF0061 family)
MQMKENKKDPSFSCLIEDKILFLLEQHLLNLKKTKSPLWKKSSWLNKAIEEKLLTDENKNVDLEFSKSPISFKIKKEIHEHLNENIKKLQKANPNITKKQWVEKAIREKILRDRNKIEELAEHIDEQLTSLI